jgi:DNA-directed RNA polymerase specialized sigma24 family protein
VLDELSEPYQAVLIYRVLEGYTGKEVAGMMGKSPDSVRVTLHRVSSDSMASSQRSFGHLKGGFERDQPSV